MKPSSILLAALLLPAAAPSALAQTTTRWTCSGINALNGSASISGDGRFIAYVTYTYPSSGPTQVRQELWWLDTQTGQRQLIILNDFGGTGGPVHSTLAGNGLGILFEDRVSYLPSDPNSLSDVYVRDANGGFELISVTPAGVAGNFGSSLPGSISFDGRYVAFSSSATNLVPNDTNGVADIFLRDRVAGTTELVSVSTAGQQANGWCGFAAVSDDGRFVAFASEATNLVPGDLGGNRDIFLRDRTSGTTQRLSVNAAGEGGNQDSPHPNSVQALAMSADGRFVAFDSGASNLTPNDTNGYIDVFVRDTVGNATRRVNLGPDNVQANRSCFDPSISADGRYVSFASQASNLVANDMNGLHSDVFVRDRLWSVTEIASVTTSGQASISDSASAAISANGRFLVFLTYAVNLGEGCTDPSESDVVQRDRGPDPFTPFCAGDGSSTACPCGNEIPAGTMAGCMHSLGTGGVLSGIGNPSIGHDTLVLQGGDMPNSPALYFQGTTAIASVFGDGLRCAGGTVVRIGTTVNAAGVSQFPNGGSPAIHVAGNVTAPGTRTYQVWFRNAATFCTPATFNLTNGLSIAWRP